MTFTFSKRRSCMSTTHRSPLEEGLYATYNLLTTSLLWAAAVVNFKTSPTDSAYGVEVSTENRKIKTNSTNNINADISMNGQKLEEVTSFKYLGATLCKDGTC